jgi:hypothetical protein
MSADPELDQLTREELVARARELGARRPEVMTRVELRDEIVRLSEPDPQARRRSRGWLGVARDLVASVMDAGLNMPGAAAAIRGDARPAAEETTGPPPVATLTLAEIYLAQGHVERALAVLEEVLTAEPELAPAIALRDRILRGDLPSGRRRPAPVIEEEPVSASAPAPFFTPPPPPAAAPAAPEPEPAPFPDLAPEPLAATVPEPAPQPEPEPAPQPEPEPAPAPLPAAATEPEPAPGIESTSFVASVPSPDAVRVPPIGFVPDPAPPTLAAPTPEPTPTPEPAPTPEPTPEPTPTPALVEAPPLAPACALARGPGAVEGYYALPSGVRGALLRVIWFVPGLDGPAQGGVDLPLGEARGRVTLPSLDRTAEVRAALGTGEGSAFLPLAVAWVYRVAEGRVSVEFAPPGDEPSGLRAQLGRAAADLGV